MHSEAELQVHKNIQSILSVLVKKLLHFEIEDNICEENIKKIYFSKLLKNGYLPP